MKPSDALQTYGDFLSDYEKKEISKYMNIFYMGQRAESKGNQG
jgi:hypothetical protein